MHSKTHRARSARRGRGIANVLNGDLDEVTRAIHLTVQRQHGASGLGFTAYSCQCIAGCNESVMLPASTDAVLAVKHCIFERTRQTATSMLYGLWSALIQIFAG